MMKNNFFFFRSSINDANKTASPPLKSKEVSSWRSVSLSSGSFYDSGSGKKNFMDLSKSPHGHSKKVHPKKSGRDSSRDLSVPVLIRTIRRLTKKKVQMASEVSSMLRNQVTERASTKEEASILQAELNSWTRRLETEKNELLEKELDRRSSDWSLKLKKYQIEQHRLHERARELAEKNVSLQRERIEQVSEKNQNLRKQLTQLQAKYRVAQDNRDYVWENYQEKVKELKSETLMTTVLREKLYFEEMDIKQLQDYLAATVRGNDILKCEVQSSLDALSYATPKLKYLELRVLKKDKNIDHLTNDFQECMKELGVVKAILPKVFQERAALKSGRLAGSSNRSAIKCLLCLSTFDFVVLIHTWFMPMHQNSTYGAAENVGTAAKPNGIMHEPIRDDRPNAFSNNSSSILSCIQTTIDIPSQTAGPSTFELPDPALVGPGREGSVRVGEIPTLSGSELSIFLYGLEQSSPHVLAFGVELGPRSFLYTINHLSYIGNG
ncbi:putative serine/arginine-rich splicing factor RS2Z32-like isoform 1 [Capsicum annuum]|nr:putative serine/arginine-rich splicing factor RS2Z32-like isoform 1 [Capsicum annuum]